ncbi:MAG: class I SAM-dependent methyltransferase, partial [Bacteroidota bacterium]|nr:class I SAM-dependent methyltransferase [Bacteroidota bacterium]
EIIGDDVIPVKLFFRVVKDLLEMETKSLEQCKGKVLDIGAGAGSNALMLQGSCDVTAIDISSGLVDIMKKRGVKDAHCISFFDMEIEKFDTIFMMMNGIGFVGDIAGFEKFLVKAKKMLNPGAKIVFDTTDVSYLFDDAEDLSYLDTGYDYLGVFDFVMEYKNVKGEKFSWLYLDYLTLTAYAHKHGFLVKKIYEDSQYSYLVTLEL